MTKITSVNELRASILLLEIKQANEGELLKAQLKTTYESLRPVNLIKNTLHELVREPDFKGDLMSTTLSLAAGYVSKKVVIGDSTNPLKQFFGTLLQMGVTSIVSKNTDEIKSAVMTLVNKLFSKKDTPA